MIENFRHKGLRGLFEDDNPKGVNPDHVRKIKQILGYCTPRRRSKRLICPRSGCIP